MEPRIETPKNIDELKQKSNCKHCWETRLSALEELSKYDCQKSREIITRLALHDKVFAVKEKAVQATQLLKILKDGKPISLGKKNIGYKEKDINKLFLRLKRENKIEEFNLDSFKVEFQRMDAEMYNVMSFDKGDKFDQWIKNKFANLPVKS